MDYVCLLRLKECAVCLYVSVEQVERPTIVLCVVCERECVCGCLGICVRVRRRGNALMCFIGCERVCDCGGVCVRR